MLDQPVYGVDVIHHDVEENDVRLVNRDLFIQLVDRRKANDLKVHADVFLNSLLDFERNQLKIRFLVIADCDF